MQPQDFHGTELITVQYLSGTDCAVRMFVRESASETDWQLILKCDGFVGRDGVGKAKEGDFRTPLGLFSLETPFGILEDPGCHMPYRKLEDHLYWCSDRPWYNQLISIKKHPHKCTGEHLVAFVPHYHYAMFIGYNKEGRYGEGSAIFLHCKSHKPFTGGCVAVEEDNMKKILQTVHKGAAIWISEKEVRPEALCVDLKILL